MLFNSINYAILLSVAFIGYWTLSHKAPKYKNLFLLTVSYFFYGSWNIKYLGLIFLSSAVDFFIGTKLKTATKNSKRRLLLACSITLNLGVLCTFKYYNFFMDSFALLLAKFGIVTDPLFLNVLLPVGISFYTFQTLSYTIDVYRKKLEPVKNPIDYLLFVSFFPQLVAGPIVRASKLLPQLTQKPTISTEQSGQALFLIGIGLVKKIAIADFLGAHLVRPIFTNPQMYSSLETLAGFYGYAFQIYADFSAYSDIAIGSAALLGFHLPENFNAPYVATNLRDFWQRWHISLSTWLRDYLYIPLGGSRKGPARTVFALMATMLLGGLWHGAALRFVFWGAIHGIALVITRVIQKRKLTEHLPPTVSKIVGAFFTFHIVCIAWVFFAAPDFDTAMAVFKSITALDFSALNLHLPATAILLLAFISHWIPRSFLQTVKQKFIMSPATIQAALIVLAVSAAYLLGTTETQPFIYFQF